MLLKTIDKMEEFYIQIYDKIAFVNTY